MAEPRSTQTTTFQATSIAWRMEGLQARLFQAARWAFLMPLMLGPVLWIVMQGLGTAAIQDLWVPAYLLAGALYTAPMLALVGMMMALSWRQGGGRVQARDGSLRVVSGTGEQAIPLAHFRAGWVTGATAELETTRGNILRLVLPSPTAAQQLLEVAGLDARHRTLRLKLGPTDFQTAMLYLLGPAAAFSVATVLSSSLYADLASVPTAARLAPLYLGLLVFMMLRGVVQAFLGPARLTIGADGVKIEQNLSHTFLPFRQLRDWHVHEDGVLFQLRDGRQVVARGRHLRMGGRSTAVLERLEEARRLHLSSNEPAKSHALLARGQRTLSDWRSGLRSLLDRSGYRQAPLSEDDLLLVLQSPDEPAELRLGAALALPPSEAAQRRLRVAAEASANPRLRVALERLADGDDDPSILEAALAEEAELPLRRLPTAWVSCRPRLGRGRACCSPSAPRASRPGRGGGAPRARSQRSRRRAPRA